MLKEIRLAIKPSLTSRLVWLASSLIDGIYLILWVAVQYGIDWIIEQLHLVGISHSIFWLFQFLFAIATVMPVLISLYKDIRCMWIRAVNEINRTQAGKRLHSLHQKD